MKFTFIVGKILHFSAGRGNNVTHLTEPCTANTRLNNKLQRKSATDQETVFLSTDQSRIEPGSTQLQIQFLFLCLTFKTILTQLKKMRLSVD